MTNEEQMEKVREKIAMVCHDDYFGGATFQSWENETAESVKESFRRLADQILTIPKLLVEAEDQSLPFARYGRYYQNAAGTTFIPVENRLAITMLSDFRRIIEV